MFEQKSQKTAAKHGANWEIDTDMWMTMPYGSILTIRIILLSAGMEVSTRPATMPPIGTSKPTFLSPNSTGSLSITHDLSIMSTEEHRTTTAWVVRQEQPALWGSLMKIGLSPMAAMVFNLGSILKIQTSFMLNPNTVCSYGMTRKAARASESSPSLLQERPTDGTGILRLSSAPILPHASILQPTSCSEAMTVETPGR